MDKVTYPSKIDGWLLAILILLPVLVIGMGVLLLFLNLVAGAVATFFGVLISGGMWAVVYPCRYTLEADHLLIQCGVIRYTVPYGNIVSAELSTNPLAAPALSLQRVQITLRSGTPGYYLVSPVRREEFISQLTEQVQAAGAQA